MNTQSPRNKLVQLLYSRGYTNPDWRVKSAPVTASIDEFFGGNTDPYSIAPNLEPHPPLAEVHQSLRDFAGRSDVTALRVGIAEVGAAEDDEWPLSDRVYVAGVFPETAIAEVANALQGEYYEEIDPKQLPVELLAAMSLGARSWIVAWD